MFDLMYINSSLQEITWSKLMFEVEKLIPQISYLNLCKEVKIFSQEVTFGSFGFLLRYAYLFIY